MKDAVFPFTVRYIIKKSKGKSGRRILSGFPTRRKAWYRKKGRIYLTLRRKAAVGSRGAPAVFPICLTDRSCQRRRKQEAEALPVSREAAKREESGEASSEKGTGASLKGRLNVRITRTLFTEGILKRRPFPLKTLSARWGKWLSGGKSLILISVKSEMIK